MPDQPNVDEAALRAALARATAALLAQRTPAGHWRGELSSSALSTATASFALARTGAAGDAAIARRGLAWLAGHQNADGGWGDTTLSHSNLSTTVLCWSAFAAPVGVREAGEPAPAPAVAAAEQYIRRACGSLEPRDIARAVAASYGEDRTFSVPILTMCALAGRLGSGRDAWRHVAQLPFELAALPHAMLKALRLPVVSYALPALVAIGQARHHHRPTRNPISRALRFAARTRTMRLLAAIQPATGGFLEAAPLTSFVLMSLQSLGAAPTAPATDDSWAGGIARVTARATAFLRQAVRPDGSWPIDTDLSTWATTLSVLALPADALAEADRQPIRDWLLAQQHVREHPYTHAAPGGWAWTDLPGGVPDADDTAGAVRALRTLTSPRRVGSASPKGCCPPPDGETDHAVNSVGSSPPGLRCPPYADAAELAAPQGGSGETPLLHSAAAAGCAWLLDLQNSDGGIPTFCRGWGRLPFDRSSQDLTAHALAAWSAWLDDLPAALAARTRGGIRAGVRFLLHAQGADGQWTPLWFGHQDAPAQANPVYGTARVLLALTDLANPGWHGHLARRGERPARGESRNPPRRVTHGRDAHATPGGPTCFDGLGQAIAKGAAFLLAARGEGGGWGGAAGTPPSIEETALAVDALAATLDWATATAMTSPPAEDLRRAVAGGAAWLVEHTRGGTEFAPAPIGLYFAKLWYFERLYPIIFTVSALRRALHVLCE